MKDTSFAMPVPGMIKINEYKGMPGPIDPAVRVLAIMPGHMTLQIRKTGATSQGGVARHMVASADMPVASVVALRDALNAYLTEQGMVSVRVA